MKLLHAAMALALIGPNAGPGPFAAEAAYHKCLIGGRPVYQDLPCPDAPHRPAVTVAPAATAAPVAAPSSAAWLRAEADARHAEEAARREAIQKDFAPSRPLPDVPDSARAEAADGGWEEADLPPARGCCATGGLAPPRELRGRRVRPVHIHVHVDSTPRPSRRRR